MASIAALPSLSDTIRQYQLFAKKSLGQHFLTDPYLLTQIVAQAGDLSGMHVLEIGPGPGGLTRALVQSQAASITALEKDARFLQVLIPLQQHAQGRLHLKEADALKTTLKDTLPAPRAVVANLPYNVGTEIMLRLLHDIAEDSASWSHILVMLQYEVAERFVAQANQPAYGRLSVLTQWLCHAEMVMHIPPEAFTPPPKVDSALLLLTPRKAPLAEASLNALQHITATAFNQRRKMLRSALKPLGVDLADLFAQTSIDGSLRAQALSVEDFCAIARYLVLHNTSIKPSK